MVELARATGRLDDPRARDLIGEAHMLEAAGSALSERIAAGMRAGVIPDNSAAIARLHRAVVQQRNTTIALELAGAERGRPPLPDDPWAEQGFNFLERQTSGIGGGTTEMARNNISERVLGMPREHTARQEHAVPRRAEGAVRELSSRTTPPVVQSFGFRTPVRPWSW